ASEARWFDGGDSAVLEHGSVGEWVTIPLASSHTQAVIRLSYSSSATTPMWRPWGRLSAPLPEVELPVLSCNWKVHLPAGLAATIPSRTICELDEQPAPGRGPPPLPTLPPPNSWQSFIAAVRGPALATSL